MYLAYNQPPVCQILPCSFHDLKKIKLIKCFERHAVHGTPMENSSQHLNKQIPK